MKPRKFLPAISTFVLLWIAFSTQAKNNIQTALFFADTLTYSELQVLHSNLNVKVAPVYFKNAGQAASENSNETTTQRIREGVAQVLIKSSLKPNEKQANFLKERIVRHVADDFSQQGENCATGAMAQMGKITRIYLRTQVDFESLEKAVNLRIIKARKLYPFKFREPAIALADKKIQYSEEALEMAKYLTNKGIVGHVISKELISHEVKVTDTGKKIPIRKVTIDAHYNITFHLHRYLKEEKVIGFTHTGEPIRKHVDHQVTPAEDAAILRYLLKGLEKASIDGLTFEGKRHKIKIEGLFNMEGKVIKERYDTLKETLHELLPPEKIGQLWTIEH